MQQVRFLAPAVLFLTLLGCDRGPKRVSVTGMLTARGVPVDGASVQSPRGACNILVVRSQDVRALFPQALGGVTQRLGDNVITQRGQGGLRRLGFAPDGLDQLRRPASAAS